MSCPAYGAIAARLAAGRILNSGLLVVGNTIFWADSWLVTWLLAYECPQVSSTPATTRTTTKSRPAAVASASKVLLRILFSSLQLLRTSARPVDLLSWAEHLAGALAARRAVRPRHAGPRSPVRRRT